MIEHENVESDIIHNEIANDIVTPVLETIVKDENFQKQKEAFWNEQGGNIPSDKSITKDIFCDRVAEMKTGKNVDYDNVLSNATNSTIDMAINNYYKQVYGKDIENSNESSFSMDNNVEITQENAKDDVSTITKIKKCCT